MVLRVDKLIVDANAFIKAYPLQEFSSSILTVPDVLKEIRDSATRRSLEFTPYELILKEPNVESVKRATEYAKSTGDYTSLSLVDIKLIALSIEVFEDTNQNKIEFKDAKIKSVIGSGGGGGRIGDKINNKDTAKPQSIENTTLPIGFHIPKLNLQKYNEHFKLFSYAGKYSFSIQDEILYAKMMEMGGSTLVGSGFPYLRRWFHHVEMLLESGVTAGEDEDIKSTENNVSEGISDEEILSDSDYDSHDDDEESEDSEDDDDEGWITPSNYKPKVMNQEPVPSLSSVGILSTDFAIQNVILHTNVPLISPYGQQITSLRSYILRCYTCFNTTSQFDKQFCPRCGNKTLRRISVSIDENGQMKLHFSSRYVLTSKGKKFSLPKPQGGKHAINPILSQDQHTTPNYRSKKAVAREIGPFSLNDVSTRSFVVKKGSAGCYWNSKNPNATRPKGSRK